MLTTRVAGLFLSAGLAVTLGCGDDTGTGAGGTAGTGGDTGALQLVQTVPADLAIDVGTDVVVTAEFDAALNEATVTASSFSLRRDGGAEVEGNAAVDGQTASYTPARLLGLITSYTAMLTTAIEGVSGQSLEASHTWGFRTRDGEWGNARLIEVSDESDANPPQVAVDPSGNAIAVWSQFDGMAVNVFANRFTATAGWGVGEPISNGAGNAFEPQVALDPNGNAVVVWFQTGGSIQNIWANRFTLADGWGMAELIETDDLGSALAPQVAVDPNGNAVAVWYQRDDARFNIWANRFTEADDWGMAELIETDNVGNASFPQVALDSNGNGVAVWEQTDGTRENIWANRFTVPDGWGTAELIETDNAGSASFPQVALDPNGNGVAVWDQFDGTRANIWANRFTVADDWGMAELIETDDDNASSPQVGVDPNGNAVAVWRQSEGTDFNIWANRFTEATAWGGAELIETDNGNASSPQVALDANGNGVAVWSQLDGMLNNVSANRFTVADGWDVAEPIETDTVGDVMFPQVAVDPNGNAIAVWSKSDETRFNIWANRFE